MKKIMNVILLALVLTTTAWAHDGGTGITVDALAKTSFSWNEAALPAYDQGIPEVTILKITIAPKTELPLHQHPVINAGVLLKGQLTVVTEDKKTLHLKAGDPIVEVVDTWHYGRNDGDTPAEIIVFYAGVKGTPITVKAPAVE
ncbi:cupin domain-containing protein [Desulfocicer niacini]